MAYDVGSVDAQKLRSYALGDFQVDIVHNLMGSIGNKYSTLAYRREIERNDLQLPRLEQETI